MKEEFPYKNLSYKLIGLAYKVYNELGYGYQEKYIQRAYERELQSESLKYLKEVAYSIDYFDKNIGRYFMDFVVEDIIVVEFKVANNFYSRYLKQVLGYLRKSGLKLGLLIIFTDDGVKIKRIANCKSV
jgi:GxxExxY protein